MLKISQSLKQFVPLIYWNEPLITWSHFLAQSVADAIALLKLTNSFSNKADETAMKH